jgi:hypothetical protein
MSKDVDIPSPSKIVDNTGVLQDTAKKLGEFLIREYHK